MQSEIFNYAIVNGQLVPVEQGQISIFSPALFASFGVYETIRVDHGRPFYLKQHLLRLLSSAQMIDLELNIDAVTLAQWFYQLADLAPQATWSLRIIVFGATESDTKPIIAMQPTRLPTYPEAFYLHGASAILYKGRRLMPACKSLNTLVNFLARREATRVGALEGILYDNGCLTEGARSNIFAVRQGQLISPPFTEILSGITREVIMQVMQEADFPVIEAPFPIDLSLYEEFFISSTSMHVMPITSINQQPIGNGQVGPITRLAMEQFNAHYRQVIGSG